MKTGKLFLLLILTFFLFSCNLLTNPGEQVDIQAIVSGTLTALPQALQDITPPPVESEPTVIPLASPTESQKSNELRVVFIGPDRNLQTWTESTGPTSILEFGDISEFKISTDGELVAFLRQDASISSSLWVSGFDGNNPRQVMSWDDLKGLKTSPDSYGASPSNLQWIPGTHRFTFTTHDLFEGPGLILNDDLIEVDADTGAWRICLQRGDGGIVKYSPDGKWMAVSTANRVIIRDINGNTSPTAPLSFTPVMTYSEYQYYPEPVWAADGSWLAVAIPPNDPLAEPKQAFSIWTMDTSGGAPVLESQVVPQFLGPVSISPDLQKYYYVKETGQPVENKREIRTAQINGQNEQVVFTGGIPIMHDWNSDSESFAYQAASQLTVTVNQLNGPPANLAGTDGTFWFRWVDETRFLFARRAGDTMEILLGKQGEGSRLLAALPTSDMFFLEIDFIR